MENSVDRYLLPYRSLFCVILLLLKMEILRRKSQFPLFVFRWLPESARWLLANGKAEEAKKYLAQCAKVNGKNEYTSTLDSEVQLTDSA